MRQYVFVIDVCVSERVECVASRARMIGGSTRHQSHSCHQTAETPFVYLFECFDLVMVDDINFKRLQMK